MKRHRFFVDQAVNVGQISLTDSELINQLVKVLRLTTGSVINLIDGAGVEAEAEISSISKSVLTVQVKEILPKQILGTKVNLFLAILKKENFELALQKATEIGVFSVTPLITERTVKLGLNFDRLNKIMIEACEQSGRQSLVVLNQPVTLTDCLEEKIDRPRVAFSLNGESTTKLNPVEEIDILVGPEGGFTEEEEKLMSSSGIRLKNLGTQTLRGETAATVGSYLAVHNLL